MKRVSLLLIGLLFAVIILASCSPAMTPPATEPGQATATAAGAVSTQAPQATAAPTYAPTATPPAQRPSPTPFIEERLIELEWPENLRLGESDLVRLALLPAEEGYVAQAEFPEHPLETQSVPVQRPDGYDLYAVARLDGVGFEISPNGDQPRLLPPGEGVSWRWSLAARQPGMQRLTVNLILRWEPQAETRARPRESTAFGRGLDVRVSSFLGLTRSQALALGLVSLAGSFGLDLVGLIGRRSKPAPLNQAAPNSRLVIEAGAGMALAAEERRLLQALFRRYARLVLEGEFLSGYSGARTFLARPVQSGGASDALTIVKIGPRKGIQDEFDNYERFVKDRLPPVTARIQHPPLAVAGSERAALQYTCINEPGRRPLSLRQALLDEPNPSLLLRLFETFGPHWWMQRQPYAFRWGQEYDRLFPPHLALEPWPGGTRGLTPPVVDQRLQVSEMAPFMVVRIGGGFTSEKRVDGGWTLTWPAAPGHAPLRARWLSKQPPGGPVLARVADTRWTLMAKWVEGCDLGDLPDPLTVLPGWLDEPVNGTRATIHGDLNLENVLVGPGSLVWLIDFAQTREGHPLFDFAHLSAELVAHVLAPRAGSLEAFREMLLAGDEPLLDAVEAISARCLFDTARPAEFYRAAALACLGTIKYPNRSPLARQCLYLAAAWYAARAERRTVHE
ncbi:MAG: phosphotransferase [Anaerolineaceae bacterium]|nr:phosphotransferase [Anaerolineaceae bacterium]